MGDQLKKYWIVTLTSIVGMAILMYSHLYNDTMFMWIGTCIIVPAASFLFLFRFTLLYYLMVFTVPLSVHLSNVGLGVGLSLPGEVLLVFVFIGVVWRMIFSFNSYQKIIYHPVSMLILAHIIWILASSIFSVLPSVSLKFALIRIVYVFVFYVYGSRLFSDKQAIYKVIGVYVLGLLPVVIFSFVNHYQHDMSVVFSNRACYPFFNDHTIYAACLVMIIPLMLASLIREQKKDTTNIWVKYLGVILFILYILALWFSYSRAGWLSLIFSLLLALPMIFRLKLKLFLLSSSVVTVAVLSMVFVMKPSTSTNSKAENVKELVYSVVNTETNTSNAERLNRWQSAFKMFLDRPAVGFGPGTYQFVYGRYQENETDISVYDSSMGGVHSEYLKPLSEQGLLGLIFFLAILFYVYYKGYLLVINEHGSSRWLLLASVTSLVTYYVHGLFNFFLDTDKSSLLFWSIIAYLVSVDLMKKESGQKVKN